MGLSARALQNNPVFPTYPLPLSLAQENAGLVAPAAAVSLLGRSGAVAMLIITYMAVTSACSAQLISVSSIFTYDLYRVSCASLIWVLVDGIHFLRPIGVPMQSPRNYLEWRISALRCGASGFRFGP